jgi:hypothetical protein
VSRCLAAAAYLAFVTACLSSDEVLSGQDMGRINEYDHSDGSWTAWRSPRCDAINCLYLVARQSGVDCTYQDVQNALRGDEKKSLLDIREAAHALGLNASIYHCSSATLASLNVPVIAHMEGTSRSDGHFGVILPSLGNSDPAVIDGYSAQLATIPADKLLRTCDGYILKPEPKGAPQYGLLAAFSFSLIAAFRIFGRPSQVLLRVPSFQRRATHRTAQPNGSFQVESP